MIKKKKSEKGEDQDEKMYTYIYISIYGKLGKRNDIDSFTNTYACYLKYFFFCTQDP